LPFRAPGISESLRCGLSYAEAMATEDRRQRRGSAAAHSAMRLRKALREIESEPSRDT